MRARHGAEAVSRRDDRQAESDRDAVKADLCTPQHGRAAAEEDQEERAENFGDEFLRHTSLFVRDMRI